MSKIILENLNWLNYVYQKPTMATVQVSVNTDTRDILKNLEFLSIPSWTEPTVSVVC